jgi:hypothetical protein
MNLPDCYDPAAQEDRRQAEWDEFADLLPVCALCHRRLYPGDKFHTASHMAICPSCVEELNENPDVVEVA